MARYTPPKLRRNAKPIRDPKIAITVYCEGGNTEPDYFKKFAQEHANPLVRVEAIGAAGVPMTIVRRAVEERRRKARTQRNSFENKDQIWATFDRDEHPQVDEAIRYAKENGVSVAFSNPCFEIWAIIHLVDYDFNQPIHRHDAQRRLRELMPRYDPNGAKILDYELLRPRYDEACKQAENMKRCREQEGDPMGNPFTNVHLLARLIKSSGKP